MEYTEAQLELLVERFRELYPTACFYCGRKVVRLRNKPLEARSKTYEMRQPRHNTRTRDHVIARAVGGQLTVICCFACNNSKADKSIEEFRHFICGGKREFFFETMLRGTIIMHMPVTLKDLMMTPWDEFSLYIPDGLNSEDLMRCPLCAALISRTPDDKEKHIVWHQQFDADNEGLRKHYLAAQQKERESWQDEG